VPGLRQNAAQGRWTVKPVLCLKTRPLPENGGNFINKQAYFLTLFVALLGAGDKRPRA
jgi:hypothetical protein